MKFLKVQFLALLCLLTFITKSQPLSSAAEIDILTCYPGEELYSLFGHSALRVQDPNTNMDIVLHYGTFDFNTPYFYIKYSQARLDYLLSIVYFDDFIRSYKRDHRSVLSQRLLLTSEQKQKLFDALLLNYEPANRAYRYESFTDNCATRIDDIIKETINGNWSTEDNIDIKSTYTYRTSYAPYLENSDWINFGLNIILGAPMEKPLKGLYLPDILRETYAHTTLNGKPIVSKTETLYDANHIYSQTPFLLSPLFIFYLLAFLLLIASIVIPRRLAIIDFILFFSLGTIGLFILYLWFATEHTTTSGNWNILWALPTHFFMSFVILRNKTKSKFTHYYFLITLIIACILLVFSIFPELFSLFNYYPLSFPFKMLTPVLLCIIFRSLGIVRKRNILIR